MFSLHRQPLIPHRGFALVQLVTILFSLALLLLTACHHRLVTARVAQKQQARYLQVLSATTGMLNRAPYLSWQPATLFWQCKNSAATAICLKQSRAHPTIVLLKATTFQQGTYKLSLYRFAYQKKGARSSSGLSLTWVAKGWFDSCPEKDATLCE